MRPGYFKAYPKAIQRSSGTLHASLRSHTKEGTMPKVRFMEMVVEIQGTIYDVVFKKSPRGKMIVTKKPDMSGVKWSKAQKANRKRMRYSNDYAKAAMADPQVRAVYEARAAEEGRVAYNVALSDYWQGKNLLPK